MQSSDRNSVESTTLVDSTFSRWLRFTEDLSLLRSEKHRRRYFEVERDAPNLLWLYILVVDAQIELPAGEVVAAMRRRLLQEEGLSLAAWRLVDNGSLLDFWLVLEAFPVQGHGERWKLLVYWLQMLSALRLKERYLSIPLQQLFLNDSLLVESALSEVYFHSVWMTFGTLRSILKEAQRRVEAGMFDFFATQELPTVLNWLASVAPDIDSNQQRAGWKFLQSNSNAWKLRNDASNIGQTWHPAVERLAIGHWIAQSISNAWDLRQLSLSQRHCAERFLDGCLADVEQILTISNLTGEIRATVRLSRSESRWEVAEVRGFANAQVADEILEMSSDLASIYSAHWRTRGS